MQKKLYSVLLFALITFSALASQNRKVLVIGIDGCRSEALQDANTPHLDSLIATGLFTYDAWHCGITVSGPSWSTIMTGVWWNKHGVTSNTYTGSHFNDYPYFPKLAKTVKPALKCVQVVEWAPMSDNVYNDGWDKKLKTPDGDGTSTAAVAVSELADADLDCMFVYFDAVDLTGHASGFSPTNPSYITAIEFVDDKIGKVLNALYSRPNYANEDWLILITTDHGGLGTGHGGNTWEERHIWWIASGKNVSHQQITAADPGTYNKFGIGVYDAGNVNQTLLKTSPVQADIAVTALDHLIYGSGLNPETDFDVDGKSWLSKFNAVQDIPVEENLTVYPNPTTGYTTFWFENPQKQGVQVEVYDLAGRLVKKFNEPEATNKVTIDLAGLNCGSYVVKLSAGQNVYNRKLILQ